MDCDVAILGGGAAGLAAARETRRRGGRAVIVNAGPLGGDCTFTGCVPSKTVIESARQGIGFTEAFERARAVVDHIAATESADRLTEDGVTVIDGEGTLTTAGRRPAIAVDGTTVTARGVVLALGSRPLVPQIPGLDAVPHLTTDTLWDLRRAPSTLAVIGGGAIGCELSQALAAMGVTVTLVEMAHRVLPNEEPRASALAAEALKAGGVEVLTGTTVTAINPAGGDPAGGDPAGGGLSLRLDNGGSLEVQQTLVAVGRRPNIDRGGLVEAGIELDGGSVANDDDLSTSLPGVYVAGDLAGRLQFTHAADHMGVLAAGNILGRLARVRPATFRADRIPRVTFTDPEIAGIGLSEREAAATVPGAMVAELPLTEHDRALTAARTDGYIKLIAGPRPLIGMAGGGRLVGATVVADRAGELIAELALAMRVGAFTGRLAQTVHPYPTWSYGLAKAAGQFFMSVEGRRARPAVEESD